MNFTLILLLGIIQGAAELLPISSSAHIIVAEKLLGLDPSAPEMTFLLVMLHTGTMFAVIAYFWPAWRHRYFISGEAFRRTAILVLIATGFTGAVGLTLKHLIEKLFLGNGEIENLFSNLPLIGGALAAVGLLIIYSGLRTKSNQVGSEINALAAAGIGAIQGLCLPFRGFSRSGATISTGLLQGIDRVRMEEFSFALAVVLTPPVIARELWRLIRMNSHGAHPLHLAPLLMPGIWGMLCSFVSGLLALKFLSRLLENGRWTFFGYYCLLAASGVFLFSYVG